MTNGYNMVHSLRFSRPSVREFSLKCINAQKQFSIKPWVSSCEASILIMIKHRLATNTLGIENVISTM